MVVTYGIWRYVKLSNFKWICVNGLKASLYFCFKLEPHPFSLVKVLLLQTKLVLMAGGTEPSHSLNFYLSKLFQLNVSSFNSVSQVNSTILRLIFSLFSFWGEALSLTTSSDSRVMFWEMEVCLTIYRNNLSNSISVWEWREQLIFFSFSSSSFTVTVSGTQ